MKNNNQEEQPLFSVSISKDTDIETQNRLIEAEYRQSKTGLIVGMLCIIIGAALSIMIALNNIEVFIKTNGIEAKIYNASPGIIFAAIGLIIIITTRAKFSHK